MNEYLICLGHNTKGLGEIRIGVLPDPIFVENRKEINNSRRNFDMYIDYDLSYKRSVVFQTPV